VNKKVGKVLLVEDNEVNQLVFEGMLTQLGYQLDIAGNGEQGVEMWKQGDYDIIFMDVQMPVMNGIEATQIIRSLEKPDMHQPIIALTANALDEDEDTCLKAGMDAFMTKPLDMKLLKETLSLLVV